MLTATDLFCGAGGEGQGGAAIPWLQWVYAANHWEKAIETHAQNFPDVKHAIVNISQLDPRYFATTDILWASPECTNHSGAKGKKRAQQAREAALTPDANGETLPVEAAERSRATMWDVVRFTEVHRYKAVIVENVVEAVHWVMWKPWILAMHVLGYRHQLVFANSMHFPGVNTVKAPQSRDRLFGVFTLRTNPAPDLELRTPTYCAQCDEVVDGIQLFKEPTKAWPKDEPRWGRFGRQYGFRCPKRTCGEQFAAPLIAPALKALDLSIPGERIGDRTTPLKPNTMDRSQYGLDQLIPAGGTWNTDPAPVWAPMRTRTTRDTEGLLRVAPFVVPTEGRDGKKPMPSVNPMRTMTARAETGLAMHPMLVPYYGTATKTARVTAPLGTLTTRDRYGLAFMTNLRGGGSKRSVKPLTDPLAAFTAGGFHHMLVRHNGVGRRSGQMCSPATEPVRTLTTKGHQSLVAVEPADRIDINDCYFRMLETHEIQAAMAFHHDYVLVGNKREKAKQLGNAVTPPAAEWLLAKVGESLGYTTAGITA